LDNAPIESFFHLLKTECLNGFPQCKDIGEFKEITKNYVDWFNDRRISQKTKGMTPCEYREHALVVKKYSILSNFCVALYNQQRQ
ncbi:IS3 family transposase, partial [Leuconostoc mesenteroides]